MSYRGRKALPPSKSGDEVDVFSKRWRKFLKWKPGQIKKIRRGFSKRARREGRKNKDDE